MGKILTHIVLPGQIDPPDAGPLKTTQVYGYDGIAYTTGDRVEIHPATDLWMRGVRYGTVAGFSLTHRDRVRVQMDKTGKRIWSGDADTFRRLPD